MTKSSAAASLAPGTSPGAGEAPAAPTEAPPAPLSPLASFFRFSERFGHMMSRVLLTVLYITLVAPAAFVLSRCCDPLGIKRYGGSSWKPWTSKNDNLSRAQRQD